VVVLTGMAAIAAGAGSRAAAAPVGGTAGVTPPAAPIRILPLGDSLTYGIGSSTRTGYRTDLLARLTAAGVEADFVGSQRNGRGPDLDHEGHPGWRIDQISARIDKWMADSRPDVVLLDIGTNDYVWDYDTELAAARLSDLLDRILMFSPGVRVVVAKLLVPLGADRARGISAFNAAVPAVAARKGPRVRVADMSRISHRNTVEGLHPNDLGYRQMSFQWYQALRPVLGGASWPATRDPFPVPSVRLTRSAAVARRGGTVTLTAQLSGALTAADLGRVPVRLMYRRLGSNAVSVLRTARTGSDGRVVFRHPLRRAGAFTVRITGGRAAGRQSSAVRVDVTS
jgi:lysophospholipase L1-like esterase